MQTHGIFLQGFHISNKNRDWRLDINKFPTKIVIEG